MMHFERLEMIEEVKRDYCCDCKAHDSVMHEGNCWEKCSEFQYHLEGLMTEAGLQTEENE